MIVQCQMADCDREATTYWWVKVEHGCAERLYCYAHASANYQADLIAFGHQNLIPGSEVV